MLLFFVTGTHSVPTKIKHLQHSLEILLQSNGIINDIQQKLEFPAEQLKVLHTFEKYLQNTLKFLIKLSLPKSSAAATASMTANKVTNSYKKIYAKTLTVTAGFGVAELCDHLRDVLDGLRIEMHLK